MAETAFDLRYNIAAFYLAILKKDIATPEQAFAIIGGKERISAYNEQDTVDMAEMVAKGMTYEEVGEMYGIRRDAVYSRIKRYKFKKTSLGGNQERSNAK